MLETKKKTKPILRFVFFSLQICFKWQRLPPIFSIHVSLEPLCPISHLPLVLCRRPVAYLVCFLPSLGYHIVTIFLHLSWPLMMCPAHVHLSLRIFYVTSIIFVSFKLYSFVICMISLYSACSYPFHVGTIQVCL